MKTERPPFYRASFVECQVEGLTCSVMASQTNGLAVKQTKSRKNLLQNYLENELKQGDWPSGIYKTGYQV